MPSGWPRYIRFNTELNKRVVERTADIAATNARLVEEVRMRREAESRLQGLVDRDSLTGLYTRRYFEEAVARGRSARAAIAWRWRGPKPSSEFQVSSFESRTEPTRNPKPSNPKLDCWCRERESNSHAIAGAGF